MPTAPLFDEIHSRALDVERFEDGLAKKVRAIMLELEADIRDALSRLEVSGQYSFRRARLEALLQQLGQSLGEAYAKVEAVSEDALRELARTEVAFSNRSLHAAFGRAASLVSVNSVAISPELITRLATATGLSFGKSLASQPLRDWLAEQSSAVRAALLSEVRRGVLAGESIDRIVARVSGTPAAEGVLSNAKTWAEAVVRTAVNGVSNSARMEVYGANSATVKGVYQVTTRDARTSVICIAYAGRRWLRKSRRYIPDGHSLPFRNGCPRHICCRSVILPWLKSWKEMGLDRSEVPRELWSAFDGKVPPGLDGASILRIKGAAVAQRILGPTRYKLWRSGALSLDDLLDSRGMVLTLDELVSSGAITAKQLASAG